MFCTENEAQILVALFVSDFGVTSTQTVKRSILLVAGGATSWAWVMKIHSTEAAFLGLSFEQSNVYERPLGDLQCLIAYSDEDRVYYLRQAHSTCLLKICYFLNRNRSFERTFSAITAPSRSPPLQTKRGARTGTGREERKGSSQPLTWNFAVLAMTPSRFSRANVAYDSFAAAAYLKARKKFIFVDIKRR